MGLCVFWMPTIWHSPIHTRLRRLDIEQNISDFGVQTILRVSIERKSENESVEEAQKDTELIKRPITIRLSWKEKDNGETMMNEVSSEFMLKYKTHSQNGMVVYEYEIPANYPTSINPDFNTFLKGICYHHVKSLFHDHEVHYDRDKGLMAYIPEPKQSFDAYSIYDNDNCALKYFIKQYEDTFSNYARRLSEQIRIYKGIVVKINGQHSQQNTINVVPGYKDLSTYGRTDFWQWYNDPNNLIEVKKMEKDVLKWSLKTNPHKKKISHYLYTYSERLGNIKDKYKELINNLPLPSFMDPEETLYYGKRMGELFKSFKNLENARRSLYRYELDHFNRVLSELEIDLGIYTPPSLLYHISHRCYYLRRLPKLEYDIFKITKDTRETIGEACEGATTEYVYCKSLLESKYNWAFKTDNYSHHAIDGRRTALNIRNSMRYVETAKYQFSNAQTYSTHYALDKADSISKIAMWIAIISLMITIISMVTSCISC